MINKYKLEPHKNIKNDLIFWIKTYLNMKLYTLSTNKVKDDFDITQYSNNIQVASTQEELKTIGKDLARAGMKNYTNYSSAILPLIDFSEHIELKNIKDFNNPIIYNDFILIYNKDKADSTKDTILKTTINFFNYIDKMNIDNYEFKINKDTNNKIIKNPLGNKFKKSVVFYTPYELQMLNKEIVKCGIARDILMIRLLMFSGITINELINIKLKDIKEIEEVNKKGTKIYVLSAINKDEEVREIPLPRKFMSRQLQNHIKENNLKDDEYLFFRTDKENIKHKLTQSPVIGNIKKVLQCTGIKKEKYSSEVLRNSYAIFLYLNGYGEKYIMYYMGYKNLRTLKDLLKSSGVRVVGCNDVFEKNFEDI